MALNLLRMIHNILDCLLPGGENGGLFFVCLELGSEAVPVLEASGRWKQNVQGINNLSWSVALVLVWLTGEASLYLAVQMETWSELRCCWSPCLPAAEGKSSATGCSLPALG